MLLPRDLENLIMEYYLQLMCGESAIYLSVSNFLLNEAPDSFGRSYHGLPHTIGLE